jgi:hypothetical protein
MQAMAMTRSQLENADRRSNPRARLQFRLAIVYPQRAGDSYRPIYHGSTHDLCMSGLSMVVEDNAFHEGIVTVLLALPPVHAWAAQKVITLTAEMTYAIHSSKLNAYKIGMTFIEFKADARELLQAALQQGAKQDDDDGAQHPDTRSGAGHTSDSQPLCWW